MLLSNATTAKRRFNLVNQQTFPNQNRFHRRLWLILAAPVVLLVAYGLWIVWWGHSNTSRIDVRMLQRSGHPLYAGAKREDGSIDYRQAIEDHFGQACPNEDNFVVAVIQTIPPLEYRYSSAWLTEEDLETLAKKYSLQLPMSHPIDRSFENESKLQKLRQDLYSGHPDWSPEDLSLAKRLLLRQSTNLDWLADETRKRKNFYCPPILEIAVSNPVTFHHSGPLAGLADQLHLIGDWFSLRAHLSIANADLVQAKTDLETLILIWDRVQQSANPTEIYGNQLVLHRVISIVNALISHPSLTESQFNEIQNLCLSLRESTMDDKSIDITLRALVGVYLDEAFLQGRSDPWMAPMNAIPPGWIDGIVVMDQYNATIDETVRYFNSSDEEFIEELNLDLVDRLVEDRFTRLIDTRQLWFQPKTAATGKTILQLHVMLDGYLRNCLANKIMSQYNVRLLDLLLAIGRFRLATNSNPSQLNDLADYLTVEAMTDPLSGKPWMWTESENTITIGSPSNRSEAIKIEIQK